MKKKRHTREKKQSQFFSSASFLLFSRFRFGSSLYRSLTLRVAKIAYTASIWNYILYIGFARVLYALLPLYLFDSAVLWDFVSCAILQHMNERKKNQQKYWSIFLCDFLRYLFKCPMVYWISILYICRFSRDEQSYKMETKPNENCITLCSSNELWMRLLFLLFECVYLYIYVFFLFGSGYSFPDGNYIDLIAYR